MSSQLELVFRPAIAADAPDIVRTTNAAYRGDAGEAGWTHEMHLVDGPRTDEAEVQALIAAPGSVMLLALAGTELVGSVLLQRQPDAAYLGMFVVKPQLQGAGIGKRLMEAAEVFVQREWGLHSMTMTAISLRRELIAFYGRRGYHPTGQIVPFPPEAANRARVQGIELAVLRKELRVS